MHTDRIVALQTKVFLTGTKEVISNLFIRKL